MIDKVKHGSLWIVKLITHVYVAGELLFCVTVVMIGELILFLIQKDVITTSNLLFSHSEEVYLRY